MRNPRHPFATQNRQDRLSRLVRLTNSDAEELTKLLAKDMPVDFL